MKKGEMLSAAIVIATNGHSGQFDRGGNPYILHPLRVMSYMKDDDEELKVMCVLHDVIEDTKITYIELMEAGISRRVIDVLRLLTKQPGQSYDEYKEAVFSSTDAMKVKLCDLRHNSDIRRLKGVTPKDLDRVSKYLQFYAEIQELLRKFHEF